MSRDPSSGLAPDGDTREGWPTRLSGVTETVVATQGPNGLWNQAALGIEPGPVEGDSLEPGATAPARARTYGATRTRRNFEAGSAAYVQFTRDPLDFVDAALAVYETAEPILASADAWTRVAVDAVDRSEERGTEIVEWSLEPIASGVRERLVPTTNRGRAAVIEATVAASRLGIEGYDDAELLERLSRLADVVDAAGDDRCQVAFEQIDEETGWRNGRE